MNAGSDGSEHGLGPIAFDRDTRRFRAQSTGGQRFGPMSTAGMVHAAFEARRSPPSGRGASREVGPDE